MTENKGTTELHSKTGGCKAEKCSFMGNRSCVDVLGGGVGGLQGCSWIWTPDPT